MCVCVFSCCGRGSFTLLSQNMIPTHHRRLNDPHGLRSGREDGKTLPLSYQRGRSVRGFRISAAQNLPYLELLPMPTLRTCLPIEERCCCIQLFTSCKANEDLMHEYVMLHTLLCYSVTNLTLITSEWNCSADLQIYSKC